MTQYTLSSMPVTVATFGLALLLSGTALAVDAPSVGEVRSLELAPEAEISVGFQSVLTQARVALATDLSTIGDGLEEVQTGIISCEAALQQKSPEISSEDARVTYQRCLAPEAWTAAELSARQAAALNSFATALGEAKRLVLAEQTRLTAMERTITEEQAVADKELSTVRDKLVALQKKLRDLEGDLSFEESQALARVVNSFQRAVRKAQRRAGELVARAKEAETLGGAIDALNKVDVLVATQAEIAQGAADEYLDIGRSIERGATSFGSTTALDLDIVVDILNSLGTSSPMPDAFPQVGDDTVPEPSLIDSLPVGGLSAEAARALIDKALATGTGEDR